MSKVLVNNSSLADIAAAIREKNESDTKYKPAEMGAAIRDIESGGGVDTLKMLMDDTLTTYSNDTSTLAKSYLFEGRKNLVTVNLAKVKESHTFMFARCTALANVNLPVIIDIATSCFESSTALKKIDLPMVTNIYASAFTNTSLNCLILRKMSLCNLKNASAFNNTPIKNGEGFIYVPKALIETYKAATNWVTYANQFRALEDYTVDGTTTGALDESKIAA